MAAYSYYYCFSLILAFGICMFVASLIRLRIVGKTMFGHDFQEEKKLGKLDYIINNKALFIGSLIAFVSVVNLLYSAWLILRLNTPDADAFLGLGSVIVTLIGGIVYRLIRNKE